MLQSQVMVKKVFTYQDGGHFGRHLGFGGQRATCIFGNIIFLEVEMYLYYVVYVRICHQT
jgi:hypothetical protein